MRIKIVGTCSSLVLLLIPFLFACHHGDQGPEPTDDMLPFEVDNDLGTVDGTVLGFGGLEDRSDALPPNGQSSVDVQMVDVNMDGRLDLIWTSQDWPATGDVQIPGR